MSQTYGIEVPGHHKAHPQRPPVRYVIVIDAGETSVAKLVSDTRQLIAEIDAGTPEVVQMTHGVQPSQGASGPEWDDALQGHGQAERARAEVYALKV